MAMRYRKASQGFTLLEVLIAIGILAIGMVTIFTLFPIGVFAVKETVEGTRAGAIAASARAEMSAGRADMRITDSLSYKLTFDPATNSVSGYMLAGPWELPSSVSVFSDCVYQYLDNGAIRNRIIFDERTMVPLVLNGTTSAGGTVAIDPNSSCHDVDRFCLETALDQPSSPWDVFARVGQHDYRIISVATDGAEHPNILVVTVDDTGRPDPIVPGARVRVQILFPVALKDPPADVPLDWAGGMIDMGTGDISSVLPAAGRNLAQYLCGDTTSAAPKCPKCGDITHGEGWLHVGEGPYEDWVQVSGVTLTGGMPSKVAFADSHTGLAGPLPFNLLLPVVRFDPNNEDIDGAGTLHIDVITDAKSGLRTAGGGQQLSMLDAGASIEVVVDGGRGIFDPVTNGSTVTQVESNPATDALLCPGNFIRVDGRDYEIATGLSGGSFDLASMVPDFGPNAPQDKRYFSIVLGYDSSVQGDARMPARFPVTAVVRDPATDNRVIYFDVGKDRNGNLPTDFFLAAGTTMPFDNPVHILPRNQSRFSYSVSFQQKALDGTFTTGDVKVTAPTCPVAPQFGVGTEGDYPLSADQVMQCIPPAAPAPTFEGFTLFTLSSALPMALGEYERYTLDNNQGAALPNALNLSAPWTPATATLPFHLLDDNGFLESDVAELNVCSGTFTSGATFTVTPVTIDPDTARFLVPGVWVKVTDSAAGTFADARVIAFDPVVPSLDIDSGGTLANGANVSVRLAQRNEFAPNYNLPCGMGKFVHGSNVVSALQPGVGFPYATASAKRYNLAVGDFIRNANDPNGEYYAVKAINTVTSPNVQFLVLDRAYVGADSVDPFYYMSPIAEAYTAQTAVYGRYEILPLLDDNNERAAAAQFFNDANGIGTVVLVKPLPAQIRAGDYIRAEGQADHQIRATGTQIPGTGDSVDGDWQWYMIESISADRSLIKLTTSYRGYYDQADESASGPPYRSPSQPASASSQLVRTYDTAIGAF